MVTPYIYQYNLSVERQLGTGLVAEVGYVGSSSHKLTAQIDHDPVDLATGNRVLNNYIGFDLLNGQIVFLPNNNGVSVTSPGKTERPETACFAPVSLGLRFRSRFTSASGTISVRGTSF